jgi:hypothetical protein
MKVSIQQQYNNMSIFQRNGINERYLKIKITQRSQRQ